MIQFNLLPDVKLEYIKSQRQKRFVLLVCSVVAIATLAVFILLFFYVRIVQAKHSSDLSKDIKSSTEQLQAVPNLNKMLTVQNQLKSLDTLHDAKPVTSRLFGFMAQVTPVEASINQLDLSYETSTLNIEGQADSLETVNKFVDTLKFTGYTTAENSTAKPAFSDVVLSSFSRDEGASYTITLKFDAAIFSNANEIELRVPSTVTTRVQSINDIDLFSGSTEPEGSR